MVPDGEPKLCGNHFRQAFLALALGEAEISARLDLEKSQKLEAVEAAFAAAEASGVLQSSLGFAANANERAMRDVGGLITSLEESGAEKAAFCGADNALHELDLGQLKTLRLEIIARGQSLYARKWELRQAIGQAASFAELDAVAVAFE